MGFEIDNESIDVKREKAVAASAKKIGTVTFIKKDTNEFVALGHSTIKNKRKLQVSGTCYDINFEGINKGSKEETGNIIASLNRNKQIGYIYYDSMCGIFGKVDEIKEDYQEVETACWYNVKKGKANILIDLNGSGLRSYEVEIIRIDYISQNKNIKIQITDKSLIAETGGIVQGMSGTPLMQDGKLVGAINYVNADEPTIAYAVFVDKLVWQFGKNMLKYKYIGRVCLFYIDEVIGG